MASTVWKGHLTFGLISVPVRLSVAARPKRVSFNMVNPKTMSRVKQQLVDATSGEAVSRKELAKGAELEDGSYVLITEEDIAKVTPKTSKTMEVLEFVKLDDVDPVYFDASYHLAPDGEAGEKPYHLLTRALEEEQHVAIAKMIRSGREYTVCIRPSGGALMLHTLFYDDEVRSVEGVEPGSVEIGEQELDLGRMFVQRLAAEWEPSKYHDTYRRALEDLVKAKSEGRETVALPAEAAPPALDLMAALKASLDLPAKKTSESAESEPAEAIQQAQ